MRHMAGGIKNLAHRGCRARCPENTMLAFRRALETPGCDGVELDVQLTKDGAPVVIHDETVERTTDGAGMVKDLTLAELRALDAGGGERVPLLEECLELAGAWPACVANIELKNSVEPYPGMEEAVIAAVRAHGLSGRVMLSSFRHDSVIVCGQLAPEREPGLLCTAAEAAPGGPLQKVIKRMRDNGINRLHLSARALSVEVLDMLERERVPLVAWSANAPGVMRRLAAEPCVELMIADDPALLAAELARAGRAVPHV